MTAGTKSNVLQRWLEQLAAHTDRSPAELEATGLTVEDFSRPGVGIDFDDGSTVRFRNAFYLADAQRPGLIAVFTEQCGYHEFVLTPDDKVFDLLSAA